MRVSSRGVSLLCLAALAAGAQADRLFLIPTGKKYLKNTLLVDSIWTAGNDDRVRLFTGFAVGESFDAEIYYERLSPGARETTFNFGYNYVVPLTDLSPGISFGVFDAMNVTQNGRRFYGAITYRVGNAGDYNWDVPAELTIGGMVGETNGLNFGVMLPFADEFRLLTEYETGTLRAGFEMRPVGGLRLWWVFERDDSYLGLGYSLRF